MHLISQRAKSAIPVQFFFPRKEKEKENYTQKYRYTQCEDSLILSRKWYLDSKKKMVFEYDAFDQSKELKRYSIIDTNFDYVGA